MSEVHRWAPRMSTVALEVVLGIGAAAGAVFAAPIGRFLLAVLAAGATVFAVQDWFARPSLIADRDGVVVRAPWAAIRLDWRQVDRIAIVTTRRLLVLHSLEIDAGETLVLLTRRRLGAPLVQVADRLEALRAGSEVDAAR